MAVFITVTKNEYFCKLKLQKFMKKTLNKDITFTAKKGAMFMIGVCVLVLALCVWVPVGNVTGNVEIIGGIVLAIVILLLLLAYFSSLLVYSINMLKAKITIGPKALVLDGAIDKTKRCWNPFRRDYIRSDLIVEIPWQAILQFKYIEGRGGINRVRIVTTDNQIYEMNLWYFSTDVTQEMDKYVQKFNINNTTTYK